MHSGTCLITISVDHCPSSQPGHSSMLSLISSCACFVDTVVFYYSNKVFNCAFFVLIHCYFCLCSIVGNPLVCGSSTTEGCSGSATLMPISFSQVSSEGLPFYLHLLGFSSFLLYNIFNMCYIFVHRKTQVQKTSNSFWGQSWLCFSHPSAFWAIVV